MSRRPLANEEALREATYLSALDNVEPRYLDCREMAHVWSRTSPFRLIDTDVEARQPRGGYRQFAERKLTCQRCTMVRRDAYAISTSRTGHTSLTKIGSTYEPPEGYYIQGVGNTARMRDLLLGYAFEQALQEAGKPRKYRRRSK